MKDKLLEDLRILREALERITIADCLETAQDIAYETLEELK